MGAGTGAAAWTEAANGRLNCDAVVMGHSRGGEAAYNVVALYPDFAGFANGLKLKAAVAIAPRVRSQPNGFDPDIVSEDVPASRVVPYLTLQGGNDGDVWGDALQAYDRMGREEEDELPTADKVLIWAYDVIHGTWGGLIPEDQRPEQCIQPDVTDTQLLMGQTLAATYIPQFLDWQVLGISDRRSTFTGLTQRDHDSSDFPPAILEPLFWQYIEPEYLDLEMRPLLYADYTVPSTDESSRLLIDTMTRGGVEEGCKTLSPSTIGQPVLVQGLDPTGVCIDHADALKFQSVSHAHETDAMRVTWEPSMSGSVTWSLDTDASEFTHFSLRIGRTALPLPEPEPTIVSVRSDAS